MIGAAPVITLHEQIDALYEFLTQQLQPHARAEEQVLYPVVAKLLDSAEATDAMRREHVEVDHFIEELNILRSKIGDKLLSTAQANQLRHVLNGLYTILKAHFAKEEEIFLPLIDRRLTPVGAQELFNKMDQVEHEAQAV
jgi:iron-sulfur cluster repair protein YtfE (RIC family)